MALVAPNIANPPPKVDKRKHRLGRFEIIVRHEESTDYSSGRPVLKKVPGWHVRWRADGNLRIVNSTEVLTSKRNAERAIEAEAGVDYVQQIEDQMWAILVDGGRREIRVIDER